MNKFYIVFGRRYEVVIHPVFNGLTPCGYIEVICKEYKHARAFASDLFGSRFDEVLTEQELKQVKEMYPCGILKSYILEYKTSKHVIYDIGSIVKDLKTNL